MTEPAIAGQVKSGGYFFLDVVPGHRRRFRWVGHILFKAGITQSHVLPDAVTGLPVRSHQNCILVQEMFTGQFCFLDCSVEIVLDEDEELE